jgi:hypothetical protein
MQLVAINSNFSKSFCGRQRFSLLLTISCEKSRLISEKLRLRFAVKDHDFRLWQKTFSYVCHFGLKKTSKARLYNSSDAYFWFAQLFGRAAVLFSF